MPRTARSPLTAIIAFAMSAPINEVKQATETMKTIVWQREEQGLKEPALPLKATKRKPRAERAERARKTSPAAGAIASTGGGETAAQQEQPALGRVQQEAAARSPRRRPPVATPVAPTAPTPAVSNGLPDQTVDHDHVE